MKLRMTLAEWLRFPFPARELIIGASAVDSSDFHQPFPIGLSAGLLPALPADPDLFVVHAKKCYWANAIFCTKTTRHVGDIRRRIVPQLQAKSWVKLHVDAHGSALSVGDTVKLYGQCKFTFSPRGAGFDCYRHYEALIWKSIPIIIGHDESLRRKYQNLPVVFTDSYVPFTPQALHNLYEQMYRRQYDFTTLCRSYWLHRRPDIDLLQQSRYWMTKFNTYAKYQRYLEPFSDQDCEDDRPLSGHVFY